MKAHTRRRMEVSMVVTALAGCGYLYTMQPDDAPRPRPRALVGEPRIAGQLPAAITAAACLKGGDPALQRLLRERGDKWLGHDRSAEGLIALWDLTRDPALLAEAAEKFPEHPHVCFAMIQQAINSPTEALPWIERLIVEEPENAEGHLLKAWALGGTDHAGALAALKATQGLIPHGFMFGPDNSLRKRMHALEDAAAACGLSPRESALLVLSRSRGDSLRRMMIRSVSGTLREEMTALQVVGKVESATEIGSLGLAIHDTLFISGMNLLGDDSTANALKRTVVSLLPSDTVMEGMHVALTAGELKDQAMAECVELADYRHAITRHEDTLLTAATDEEVGGYAFRFLEMGEAVAFTWLSEQAAAMRAPAPDLPAPHPGP